MMVDQSVVDRKSRAQKQITRFSVFNLNAMILTIYLIVKWIS